MKFKNDINKRQPSEWNQKIKNKDVDFIVRYFNQTSKGIQFIGHVIKNVLMERKWFTCRTISPFQATTNHKCQHRD
jgi:hypothetical protein